MGSNKQKPSERRRKFPSLRQEPPRSFRDHDEFDDFIVEFDGFITAHAWKTRVPGLDAEDVAQEMRIAYLLAWRSFDERLGLRFEQYAWAVWMNRRGKLFRAFFTDKRAADAKAVSYTLEELEAFCPLFVPSELAEEPPPSFQPLARWVWRMLAYGYTRAEIMEALSISKRKYYAIIESFRTWEVEVMLTT